ncbi:queuosine salvage family protein [Streptomyces nanshensis]|nr:queuosine salvage family protein [Streptomyces nanshensis]
MSVLIDRGTITARIDEIVRGAEHVSIDHDRVNDLARRMAERLLGADRHATPTLLTPDQGPMVNDRDTLQFYLMRRSQSFTIWRWTDAAQHGVEAWDCHVNGELYTGERAVSACIMRAIDDGLPLLDADFLETITREQLADVYRDEVTGEVTYQMLDHRLEKLHEIGRVLNRFYDGHMVNLMERADGRMFREDGNGSVQRIAADFPKSYGDEPFVKLAITVVHQLHNRLDAGLPTTEEFARLVRIDDPENSLGPADYYIPLFLTRWGVFRLSEEMTAMLRERRPIAMDSAMEREFRAATVAVFDEVQRRSGVVLAELDHEFWYHSAFRCRPCHPGASEEDVPCPIRDDCTAFQRRPALMELGWPLVYTPYY